VTKQDGNTQDKLKHDETSSGSARRRDARDGGKSSAAVRRVVIAFAMRLRPVRQDGSKNFPMFAALQDRPFIA
jgi:hypothetical protein